MTYDKTIYYGPDEPAETIFLERTFLAGDCINGMYFGILICMYFSCMQLLWVQRRARKFSTFIMLYLTLLFLTLIIFVSVSAGTVQLIYIDNRNYPGGPWQFFLDTQNLAINVLFIATFFLLTFLADSLIFWRCWIIWSASHRTSAIIGTFFPGLLLAASFAIGTIWVLQSSQPGLSFYSKLPMAFGTAYYSLSIGMNIILTFLITIKLLIYRRRFREAGGADTAANLYTSLLTIFIESAALYSTFAICFLVTYAISNPLNQTFLGFTTGAQQISAYLIIYRLAAGTAWQKDTLEKNMLSTVKFNVSTQQMARSTNILDSTMSAPSDLNSPSSPSVGFAIKSAGTSRSDV